ncbi:MAG: GreA/GreB family elongation factor [Geobacteraceae bacterium]|nr:GreA/GreB family elongation factor [Geobacteraceae bacterium]NTW78615.1 GreA/GreB family elongation factor [Geobacteraceae bacterium]
MSKELIIKEIIRILSANLTVLSTASRASHAAATHAECLPDNKYDTTALEASYIAQGQANRAQEIRIALECYRTLTPHDFDDETPIRLTALVDLADAGGDVRRFFLGPQSGGMKIGDEGGEVVVITPGSPLGRSLLGLRCGDEVKAGAVSFTIVAIC